MGVGSTPGRRALSLIFSRIATSAQLATTEDPPWARNGMVIPVSGIRPVTPPATTNTCSAIAEESPTAKSLPKGSRAATAVRRPRWISRA